MNFKNLVDVGKKLLSEPTIREGLVQLGTALLCILLRSCEKWTDSDRTPPKQRKKG